MSDNADDARPQSPSRDPSPPSKSPAKKSSRSRSRSPKSPKSRSPSRDRRRSRSRSPRRRSPFLFVGNLPYSFRERDIGDLFERSGRVVNVTLGFNRRTGQTKGYAFVEFKYDEDAEDAYNRFNGYNVEGRALRVDFDAGLQNKQRRSDRSDRDRDHRPSPYSRNRYDRSPRRSDRDRPPPRYSSRSRSPSPRRN